MTEYNSSILQELEWRGFIHQMTAEEVDELLAEEDVTLYCGFDPSAPSLQVGNLLAVMNLAFFRRHGHDPMALVGGATGLIGDPSGKSEERTLLDEEELEENIQGVETQLRTILDRALEMHPESIERSDADDTPVPLVNNAEWIKSWSYIDLLREVGKYFRVNQMMAKESVRARLEEREQGISYTEFSYMIIQALDYAHLYETRGCRLQVGGSDQWGNITAGTDLVRRKLGETVYGITAPLITSESGEKLGKTAAGGAIWLDDERTSPYDFYQYWYRQNDADMAQLLRMFTFLPKEEIDEMVGTIERGENRGEVQQKLAWEVTALVHGPEQADLAVRASEILYGETIEDLSDEELASIFSDVPSTEIPRDRLGGGIDVVELFDETDLQSSKGAARRLLKQGGGYLNNERIESKDYEITSDDLASETMLVLRSGKKNYHVVKFV